MPSRRSENGIKRLDTSPHLLLPCHHLLPSLRTATRAEPSRGICALSQQPRPHTESGQQRQDQPLRHRAASKRTCDAGFGVVRVAADGEAGAPRGEAFTLSERGEAIGRRDGEEAGPESEPRPESDPRTAAAMPEQRDEKRQRARWG